MSDERRTEGVPHDRLTRMCEAAITAFEAHPEHQDGDSVVVVAVNTYGRSSRLTVRTCRPT